MQTRTRAWIEAVIAAELRRAILWAPVGLGVGIWLYLAAAVEPPAWAVWLPLAPALALAGLHRRMGCRLVFGAALAVTTGHALAQTSAWRAHQPTLDRPTTTTIEGRVVARDRSASGAPRLTLDRVSGFTLPERVTPERVRVSLIGTPLAEAPRPGDWVHVFATLLPPGHPVEPGGFDFARRAYFDHLGAVGFARTPALRVPPEERAGARAAAPVGPLARLGARLERTRLALAEGVRAEMPGAAGAFAAAIMLGDRGAIDEADAEALRISSLAHLLAISGLHMGLLTGLVFATVRMALALAPPVRRGWPAKKVAAGAALAAGAAYLALSGATLATQRAFVMAAVALVAVMLDRPAISLRAIALAAAVVLAIRPVSLVDPGFQMSFAATIALVAAYDALRERRRRAADGATRRPGTLGALAARFAPSQTVEADAPEPAPDRPVGVRAAILAWLRRASRSLVLGAAAVTFTSVVAGLATTPFSAAHFNRLAPFGLVANLAAVPVMGALVAPMAVTAAVAAPFGLAGLPLAAMGAGIDWILVVAHWTANLPGADARVGEGPGWRLGALALAGLWLALWRGPWRLMGLAALGLCLGLAEPARRPDVLIAPGARLVGVMGPEGRALDRAVGQGYAAERWLAADGDGASQAEAARRPGLVPSPDEKGRRRGPLSARIGRGDAARDLVVLAGRLTTPERLARACRPRAIVVAPFADEAPEGACLFLGRAAMTGAGALAITIDDGAPVIESSAAVGGRPWHHARR
ncbi:MAG: ComEC/Rec2 family competence protein [Paracoccaceae bacterium]